MHFFKWVVVGRVKVGDLPTPPENSSGGISSVAMQQWNVEHRVFAIEQFFRNNDSVVTVRLFRRQFNVACDGAIPDVTQYSDGLNHFTQLDQL